MNARSKSYCCIYLTMFIQLFFFLCVTKYLNKNNNFARKWHSACYESSNIILSHVWAYIIIFSFRWIFFFCVMSQALLVPWFFVTLFLFRRYAYIRNSERIFGSHFFLFGKYKYFVIFFFFRFAKFVFIR